MASSDVFVTFGADTGALEASVAVAKAQIQAMAAEMRKTATEFNKAGAAADSDLGQKLQALGERLAIAKGHMAGLQASSKTAADSIKQMSEKIGNAAYQYGPWSGAQVQMAQIVGETVAKGFNKAGLAVGGLGVALGAVAIAAGASLAIVGAEVNGLRSLDDAARAAKLSLTALQNLNAAGAGVGIDAAQMNSEMAGFAEKLREAQQSGGELADFLKKNAIAIKDAHGNLLPVQEIFGKVADLILSSNNEMDRLAALTKVGFSSDMLRLMERQKEAVKEFAASSISAQDEVLKRGLADGEALDAEWSKDWTAIKRTAESAAVEVLATISDIQRLGGPKFTELANGAKSAFQQMAGDAKTAAAEIQKAFEAQQNEVIRRQKSDLATGKNPYGDLSGNTFGGKTVPAPKSDTPTIKGLYDKDDSSKNKSEHDNAARLAQETARDETAAAKSTFDSERALIDEKAKLHIISAQQQIAATRNALNAETAAERAALQEELKTRGLKPEQIKAINNQILQLERQHQAELQKLHFQEVEDAIRPWIQMVDTISSSFSSSMSGMIEGTKNFRQAMQSMAQGIERELVKMATDSAATWVKSQIAEVAGFQAKEVAKTGAAATGAAAREGIGAGEAASGVATMIGNAIKTITVDAGQAGAGVAAFLAPIMGPGAVAAGAATQGAVLSMAAFDIGAYRLDEDQIAMVHKNELIMPAAEAGAFRSMLSGAASGGVTGGGDTHHHYSGDIHVNAAQGDIEKLIKANPKGAARGFYYLVKNGHHL